MAHDLGKALGIGAYLTALERTAIGEFSVSQALTLNAFLDSLKTD
jgi:tRNA pseudouridine55 synthase